MFLEMEPQSNHYHQILFNPEQFKKLSDFLHELFPAPPDHVCKNEKCTSFLISDEGVDLPDVMDIHHCTPEQITSGECKH